MSGILAADPDFNEVSVSAGVAYTHGLVGGVTNVDETESGGVAVGDYDNDGHLDLYLVTGDAYDNVLLQNTGSGTFSDQTAGSGVALPNHLSAGPLFADINGDGWQDLLVGTIEGNGYKVFLNNQDGSFTDVSNSVGITPSGDFQNDISSAAGDADNDGDLDLFIGHHTFIPVSDMTNLWLNDGTGTFSPGDASAGIDAWPDRDVSFSPTFVDINNDGWQDLLVSADGGFSQVFLNDGDGTYSNITTSEIDDRNGMGSAPADYDNDGDIDWFVTAISSANSFGNRLYENDGQGIFTNVTSTAGVRNGSWGWGACAADFDNDGWLDIFHVNGMTGFGEDYETDVSRLFMNNHDGTFTESSSASNLEDTGQGRGVVCFDYDEDGVIDIFVANNDGPTRLYKNVLETNPGWLQIDVIAEANNWTTAGTVIEIDTGSLTQHRQLTLGSNFESQMPLRQHFGLGGAAVVDEVRVTWPSGTQRVLSNVSINQILTISPGPWVTEISPSTAGPTHADSVAFTVAFNEEIVNFDSPGDVLITHSGTSHGGVNISGSGSSYTATITGILGTGSFTLEVDTDSDVENSFGSPLASSVISVPVLIDNSIPSLFLSPPSAGSTTDGPVSYTVTYAGADFIELGRADVTLNRTGSADGHVTVSGSGTSARVVTIDHIVGTGTLGISIKPGTASDAAGNTAMASEPAETFAVSPGDLIHYDSFEER